MPLREYKCPHCEKAFDRIISSGEEKELQECPKCGKIESTLQPAILGGYKILGNNSASTRPAGGAFKKGKK